MKKIVTKAELGKIMENAYNDYCANIIDKNKECLILGNLSRVYHSPHPLFVRTISSKRIIITNIKTGKSAMSKCNANVDTFSIRIGTAIAWLRYCGQEIPEINKTLTDIPFGTVFKFPNCETEWMLLCKHPRTGNYVLTEATNQTIMTTVSDGTKEVELIR